MFDEIFYSECLNCKSKISDRQSFCEECLKKVLAVSTKCEKCGYPLHVNSSICKNCFDINSYEKLYIPYWYSGSLKILLKEIKFRYNIKGLKVLHGLIRRKLFKMGRYDYVTSVPSTFWRRFRRFVHPAQYIAWQLCEIYNLKYDVLLKRARHTEYQWKLKRKEREENIKNAFIPKKELFDLKILLVDDIMTSGATIRECSRVLKDAGAAKVDCYIFSKGMFK
jgi:ComF family protein